MFPKEWSDNKGKVYYERETVELREKSLRAQKLVKTYNGCDPEEKK
ncbi:hypothetical protein FY526_27100 [Clostridioides difficile]|nr:hypothetical protein FY526_27100 [Clostridioides difficile]